MTRPASESSSLKAIEKVERTVKGSLLDKTASRARLTVRRDGKGKFQHPLVLFLDDKANRQQAVHLVSISSKWRDISLISCRSRCEPATNGSVLVDVQLRQLRAKKTHCTVCDI